MQAYIDSVSEDSHEGVAASLSDDAKNLLIAAKNADGYILYLRYSGGASLQIANTNFIEREGHREEMRWKAALDELLNQGLVEALGSKGETFQLTSLGYELADQIEEVTDNIPPPAPTTPD